MELVLRTLWIENFRGWLVKGKERSTVRIVLLAGCKNNLFTRTNFLLNSIILSGWVSKDTRTPSPRLQNYEKVDRGRWLLDHTLGP